MTVEDGSTITVAPPGSVRTIGRTKSGDVVTSDAQRRGQLTRAASVGDLRLGSTNERVEKDLGSPYSARFELYGLTIGMRLRNYLLHLIDVLRLYQDFDMCSGYVYNPSTHEQFFSVIDILVLEAEQLANSLVDWGERGRDQHQLRRLIHVEYEMRGTWSHHYNWITKTSNGRVEKSWEENRLVREKIWEDRKERCMKAAEKMLCLSVDSVDENYPDYAEIEEELMAKWKADGKLRGWELVKRIWALLARSDY